MKITPNEHLSHLCPGSTGNDPECFPVQETAYDLCVLLFLFRCLFLRKDFYLLVIQFINGNGQRFLSCCSGNHGVLPRNKLSGASGSRNDDGITALYHRLFSWLNIAVYYVD